ncbi:MAG: hypothetical protein AAFU85_34445, partial [Planctomycetota bacterium]
IRVDGETEPGITETVSLEGGEAIELFVEERELLAFPFDQDVAHQSQLTDANGQSTNLVLRVHRPRRIASGDAEFMVSWQNADDSGRSRWRATARPLSYWVEIQPLDARSQSLGPPFVFYDRQFENRVAVPAARLTAEDWPEQARRAGVRVWVTPCRTSGLALQAPGDATQVAVRGIHEVVEFDASDRDPMLLTGQTFVRMDSLSPEEDTGVCHRFVVRSEDGATPISSIKIQPQSMEPVRIVRQFDEEHHVAVHRFYYETTTSAAERYLITDRTTATFGSLRSEGSVEVDVPDVGGLLPVGVSAQRERLNR